MKEHQVILNVLDALEEFTQQLEANHRPVLADLDRFAYFFQQYADKYHHAKEEDHLFAEMVKAGFPGEQGPIGAMLVEHEEGRRLVARMQAASSFEHPLEQAKLDRLVQDLTVFVELLRGHIYKEDQILYPMALNAVDDSALAAMENEFDHQEKVAQGNGQLEAMTKSAETLMNRYVAVNS
ncbi:hemerythrin domain-containing protein [bacterium]|nr:hemerythrin domain-containing protein [bacterium]